VDIPIVTRGRPIVVEYTLAITMDIPITKDILAIAEDILAIVEGTASTPAITRDIPMARYILVVAKDKPEAGYRPYSIGRVVATSIPKAEDTQ
jgi:hypothetical protein